MRKSILILLLILTSNFLFSQQKLSVKPEKFSYENIFFHSDKNIQVINQSRVYSTPFGIFEVFPNIRLFPSSVNQTTISAGLNILNPAYIIVGANTDLGLGYYITQNAGVNWIGANTLPGAVVTSQNPSVILNGSNVVFYNYYDDYLVTDRSTNFGASWQGRVTTSLNAPYDQNYMTSDQIAASPYYNRIYVGWTKWTGTYPTMLSYSTNGGATYSAEQQIGSPAAGHYEQGCNIQTGPTGNVYCVWATPQISNNIEDKIGFTYSTNGGVNWAVPATPLTIGGIRGTLLSLNIRVHSLPSLAVDHSGTGRDGNIYVCWAQKNLAPAGTDADIIFARSTNNGTTWSSPVRVNDDEINNGKPQFFPSMAVDQATGNIAIVFYDTRDNVTNDSCNTYVALSSDAGTTWVNIKVSDMPQMPKPITGYATGYYTDKIGLVFQNNTAMPFWADNRNGVVQVYTSKINIGPVITHNALHDTENVAGPYIVNAIITPFGSPLTTGETKVFWGRGGLTDSIVMTNTSGNNWTASLPGNGTPAEYRYYIKTFDNLFRTVTSPAGAPGTYNKFFAGADTIRPVITHTPIADTPRSAWPLSAICYVTDNIGVDTVWVKWSINNPGNLNRIFGLSNQSGITYSGPFNAGISELAFGDSVYYRIYARDKSAAHNIDSTILYKFNIKLFARVVVGNGTLLTSYPFFSFYTDSRTDIMYLGSELSASGGASGWITEVFFNFNSAAAVTLNNLSIKILQTTNSSVTGFTTSGWTNSYTGNFTVPGLGWRSVTLQTPFNWNGTSNILLEVCFDNTTFGSNSNVYATSKPNMTWHQHQDLTSGSGCTDLITGAAQDARPNVAFSIMLHVGVENQISFTPSDFKLNQNYPNPFNPVTKISYSIPKSNTYVKLAVYDLLGKEVSILVNGKRDAGTYLVDFNADNLSSGVYFYKLETQGFTETRRMVVLK